MNLRFGWDKRGATTCTYTLPNEGLDKMRVAIRQGGAMVDVSGNHGLTWRGRVSAATLGDNAIHVTAHGLQYELDAVRVAHYWVHSRVSDWVQAVDQNNVLYPFTNARQNQQFTCDNNNRLYIALTKGNTYANNATAAWYLLPVHSPVSETTSAPLWTRPIRRVKATYEMLVPSGFEWRVVGEHLANPPSSTDIVVWNTLVGTGVLQTGSIDISVAANMRYTARMSLANNTGGNYTMAGETGAMYLRLTGVEIITGTGAAVYPDEVVTSLAALVATQRGLPFFSSSLTVAATGIELKHEVYKDMPVSAVLTRLADYGDTNGQRCAWWVDNNYAVYLSRVQDGTGRTFVVRAKGEDVRYDLRRVPNRTYGVYSDARGYPFRTAWVNDAAGQAVQGTITTLSVTAQTTSATVAGQVASSVRDSKRGLQARLVVDNVLTTTGNEFPFWQLRVGDIIQNASELPSNTTLAGGTDTFYLAGWEYSEQGITMFADEDAPSVANMLAQ
jgi:hypothetical protein